MLTDKRNKTHPSKKKNKTQNAKHYTRTFLFNQKIDFTLEKIRIFSTVGARCKQGNG